MDTFLGIIAAYFIFYWYMHSKKKKMVSFQPALENKPFNPIAMIIDTETTGLIIDNYIQATKKNVTEFSENFPRIVQLCYILVDNKGNYKGDSFYIKQKNPIPKEVIKIHGITDEKCEKDGVELEKALSTLTIESNKIDDIVGHNIAFDYKVLHAEYIRANKPFPLRNKNKIDTMKLTTKYLGLKHGYKISLYNSADKLFGKKKEWKQLRNTLTKHNAESDAIVAALIFNFLKSKS